MKNRRPVGPTHFLRYALSRFERHRLVLSYGAASLRLPDICFSIERNPGELELFLLLSRRPLLGSEL